MCCTSESTTLAGFFELKGGILQLLGALRKTGLLVFHIFGLMNACYTNGLKS